MLDIEECTREIMPYASPYESIYIKNKGWPT